MNWGTKSIQKLQRTPPEKPKRIFEGGEIKGFHVQITPAGTITPTLQYPINGKKTFFPCGSKLKAGQPDKVVGAWLKKARRAAEDAREVVDEGGDPKADKAAQVIEEKAAQGGTVAELIDIYLWTLEGKFSQKKTTEDLERDVIPAIGSKTANAVTVEDISSIMETVYTRAASKGFEGD